MTPDTNNAQVQQPEQRQQSDKELNFRKQEQMFQRMLAEKEAKLAEMERKLNERLAHNSDSDDDSDADPYVDKRKLRKELSQFEQKTRQSTQQEIQNAVSQALAEERRQQWLRSNPDFQNVMQHVQRFAEADPELAETILEMPDTFERQKLVYKNIKALGLHKPPENKPSIQETIDANRRAPYYQPSGIGTPPYGGVTAGKSYSNADMENSYKQMQQLKNRLRLG